MERLNFEWSTEGLTREIASAEQVFATGSPRTRLSALCWMAVIISAIPHGDFLEQAEDRLSDLIAEARLAQEDLNLVLAFRRRGMFAETWPSMPTLRR
jgi:hypothetical protein